MPDIIEIYRITTARPGVVGQLVSVFALVDGIPRLVPRDEWVELVDQPGTQLYRATRTDKIPDLDEQRRILAAGPVYTAPSAAC